MKAMKILVASAALALGMAATANAASITFWDNGINNATDDSLARAATWTLDSETGCITCEVTLSVVFSNPTTYDDFAKYLDSVQFSVAQKKISSLTLLSTTAGSTDDWLFGTGNLNANGCSFPNPQNSGCGEWDGVAPGFGPITADLSLEWVLSVTFASQLESFTTGNVRAAFNDANGGNVRIFSPSGDTSDGDGDSDDVVPEPATMALFGLGLALAAGQVRKRMR